MSGPIAPKLGVFCGVKRMAEKRVIPEFNNRDTWPKMLNNHPFLFCGGCGHLFYEPRQFNNVREVNGALMGECPVCKTTNDISRIRIAAA